MTCAELFLYMWIKSLRFIWTNDRCWNIIPVANPLDLGHALLKDASLLVHI